MDSEDTACTQPTAEPSRSRLDSLIDSLAELHSELREEADRQERRANIAEDRAVSTQQDLVLARAELAQVRAELDQTRRMLNDTRQEADASRRESDQRHGRLIAGLREFVTENSKAQRALLAVTRHVLGVAPLPPITGEEAPSDTESEPGPEAPTATSEAAAPQPERAEVWFPEQAISMSSPLRLWMPEARSADSDLAELPDDPITDEVQIIDARNASDLQRLDASSYMRSFRTRRAPA